MAPCRKALVVSLISGMRQARIEAEREKHKIMKGKNVSWIGDGVYFAMVSLPRLAPFAIPVNSSEMVNSKSNNRFL